jgi:signal transduction histidine kinase
MERALAETNKWLEIKEIVQKSQARAVAAEFAAIVIHEINSPLEAAFNLNYLIQQSAEDAESVRRYSRLMEEQFGNLARISRQTLSFYRSAETGEAVSIETLVDAALRVYSQRMAAKKLHLVKSVPQGAMVKAHAGDLLQVMSNLISNAIEALRECGTLQLRARCGAHEVHITVADNGSGIPKDILARIFDPFFTTKKERGTGLGLAISKMIVERHRGRIRVRSSVRPGQSGTVFRVTLPRSN